MSAPACRTPITFLEDARCSIRVALSGCVRWGSDVPGLPGQLHRERRATRLGVAGETVPGLDPEEAVVRVVAPAFLANGSRHPRCRYGTEGVRRRRCLLGGCSLLGRLLGRKSLEVGLHLGLLDGLVEDGLVDGLDE